MDFFRAAALIPAADQPDLRVDEQTLVPTLIRVREREGLGCDGSHGARLGAGALHR